MPRGRLYIVTKEVRARSVAEALAREPQHPVLECYPKRQQDEDDGSSAIGFVVPDEEG